MDLSDILFVDTEATGLAIHSTSKLFGIAWALGDRPVQYIDVRREDTSPFLRDVDRCKRIVAHGMKFDAMALYRYGIDILNKELDCTIVRAQLLDEHKLRYDLDALTGQKDDIIEQLADQFGGPKTKNVQMKNLHKADPDFTAGYAKQDVVAMRNLYIDQAHQDFPGIYYLEKKVLKTLIRMELRGTRVDIPKAERAVSKVNVMISQTQTELNKLVGREINVNSTPQMQALFEPKEEGSKMRLIDGTLTNKTGKGKASIDKDCLEQMTHPAAKLILKIRKYAKIHDTFLVSQLLNHHVNGRVHPWFNQTRVVTGRLSCNNPNLQAIPKRDPEMKSLLRPLFLPDDGKSLLRCDYDQSDVRGFAHYITSMGKHENHPVLLAYEKDPDTDFHQFVSDMMGIQRNPGVGGGANAKQINLAMIFNMGAGKLAREMGMDYFEDEGRNGKVYMKPGDEAQEVFNNYHKAIPGAADMGKMASSRALKNGHVYSICGRYLRFPKRLKWAAYKASGYLYQSFTADLIKWAMVVTEPMADLHLSIHDELIFSFDRPEQILEVKEAMESVFKDLTKIPIRTQPEVGRSWGETKPYTTGGQND